MPAVAFRLISAALVAIATLTDGAAPPAKTPDAIVAQLAEETQKS